MANNSLLMPEDIAAENEVAAEEEQEKSRLAEIAEVVARGGSPLSVMTTSLLGKDVATDLASVAGKTVSSVGRAAKDVVNIAAEQLTDEPLIPQETADKVEAAVAKQVEKGTGLDVYDEELAEYRGTETVTGAVAELASFIYVGSKVTKMPGINKLPSFRKEAAAGFITDQLLGNPDENIANTINEMTQSDILDFLAAKEDDSDLVKRLKLAGEGLGLASLISLIGNVGVTGKKIYDKYKKPVGELTPEEQGEVFVETLSDVRDQARTQADKWTEEGVDPDEIAEDYLERSKRVQGLQDPEYRIQYNETPEGQAQVEMQASSPIRRFVNQVFTSRGYWTPKAYDAFEDAQYAQRQAVAQAEHVANRLQRSLRELSSEVESEEVSELVQKALTSDLGFVAGASREEKVLDLIEKFSLPSEVAENVLDARELIDGFSKSLVGSSGVPDAIKEAIVENAGMYLRRSYRLYEDKGYKPTLAVVEDAQEYLIKQAMDADPSLGYQEALARAESTVQDILGDTDQTNVFEYFSNVRKVNTEIMQGRKDIPEPIRALMGEIKEPSENIILTVSKMARFYETNKFFTVLGDMGDGKYIFSPGDTARDASMFNVKITGTNSSLDGKFTSPEMLRAIKERQSDLGVATGDKFVGSLYRNFLTLKGVSQKAKTVYSHVTHLRNFLGGMQFSMANGSMPFGEATVQTFKVLKNQIGMQGEKGLDELYEKYLRLGIINTNVRANEFRDLLETGYNSTADNLADAISEKLTKYGLPKGVQDAPGNIYVATDDFFKITQYNKELDSLKKAFPNEDIKVLEEEAANIVRNTIPNYDRVPNGIKTLRGLPFGSFVSFPAEIYRTSMNIVRQASREIGSGNPELVARGRRRLAGFSTSVVGWGGMATLSANMVGFGEVEQQAAHTLSESPWSKDAPRIWMNMDDKLFYLDTQFIDSYSAIKEPILAVLHEIQSGQLKGDELDEYLLKASVRGLEAVIKPYVSEAILTKTVSDLRFAYKDPEGRTPEGKEIFTPGLPKSEKLGNFMYYGLQAFLPGSVTSIEGLVDAALETPNKTTGTPKNLQAELLVNMSGLRFRELNIQDALTFAVKDYKSKRSDVITSGVNYERKPEELVERYRLEQKQAFKYQQELYMKVSAAIDLIGVEEVAPILMNAGMSNMQIAQIVSGRFAPNVKDRNFYLHMIRKTPNARATISKTADELQKLYASFAFQPLVSPEELKKIKARRGFEKGGMVNVPNAPAEPDERIDKMTGLPYNYQAGKAFIDVEDTEARAAFSKGSAVVKLVDEAIEAGSALKEGFKKLTDGLFSDETIDDTVTTVRSKIDEQLVAEGRDDLLTDPELEMYIDYASQDILSGGRDLDIPTGVSTPAEPTASFKSYLSEGTGVEPVEDMTLEIFDDYQDLKNKVDPDGTIFNAIFGGLSKPRADYMQLTSALDAPVSLPKNSQIFEELIRESIELDDVLTSGLSEKGAKRLVKSQVNALANDPDTAEAVARISKEAPEDAPIPEVLNLDMREREALKDTFIAESVEQKPVYRATSSYQNKEYDIAFAVPREIGVHVGTEGQANDIALLAIDPFAKMNSLPYTRESVDDSFKQYGDRVAEESKVLEEARKINPEIREEDLDLDLQYPELTMSRGYINIKNPLVIDEDYINWNAVSILETQMDGLVEAIAEQAGDDALFLFDEVVEGLRDKVDFIKDLEESAFSTYDKEKIKLLTAEVNLNFRDLLEDLGFDSIKYKNAGERALAGEEDYSYILFNPQQFKSVNAEKFDLTDKRFGKYTGGKIVESLNKKISEGKKSLGTMAAEKVGIKADDIEWARNMGREYGDKEEYLGRGDAARHLALGWLARQSRTPKLAKFGIDAREAFSAKPLEKQQDLQNNQLGFEIEAANKAEAARQIRELVDSRKATIVNPRDVGY